MEVKEKVNQQEAQNTKSGPTQPGKGKEKWSFVQKLEESSTECWMTKQPFNKSHCLTGT